MNIPGGMRLAVTELIIIIVEIRGIMELHPLVTTMVKMELLKALRLMDAMICVEMSGIGLIVGQIRPGFCVAGRGSATAQASIYVPGIATTSTLLTSTAMSAFVVPGLLSNY